MDYSREPLLHIEVHDSVAIIDFAMVYGPWTMV